MPNISINKSDLQDLGISLKDILLAITKSKNTDSDVIKIKRKKPRKKNKPKSNPLLRKKVPNFYGKIPSGGGGGGIFSHSQTPAPIVTNVTNAIPNNSSAEKDNQMNYIKNQIEDFKRDNEMKLLTQQNQLTNFQNMNHLGMRLIYNKLENPLTNITTGTFRQQQPVDRNDGLGIVATNNFYENNRVEIIDDEQPTELNVDEPVKTEDGISVLEQVPENEDGITPVEIQPVEPVSFESALEQEVKKEETKKLGRPKGSKNKPKNPLTQEAIKQDTEIPDTKF